MAKTSEWLVSQNRKRHEAALARGTAGRVCRHGHGRALARQAWSARRSLAREMHRRRLGVIGRVRLHGKGPPPRPGPLNRRRPAVATQGREPLDQSMLAVIEQHWAAEDADAERERRCAEVARRVAATARRATGLPLASGLPLAKRSWDHRMRMPGAWEYRMHM